MNVQVRYFAGLREALSCGVEELAVPDAETTVAGLRDLIAARGDRWACLAETRNLRAAVNQVMVGFDAPVREGDEVAFFPPVTGG